MRTKIIIISIFVILALGLWSMVYGGQEPRKIRVAIIQDATSLSLKVNGFYEITDSKQGKALFRGKNLKTIVTSYKDGMLVGGKVFSTEKLFIRVNDSGMIIINGGKFRGSIQLIKDNFAKLSAINYIDLEDYIKGILYHEASHYWPMEALKAQAIACRTYAVYHCQVNKNKDFDATSDIYSQVYGGWNSERYRTSEAVRETQGLILTHKGRVFPAYFHATCSGHTEDASLLWNIDIEPLKGVVCNFCKDSPHSNWHYVLSLPEIQEALLKAGYKIGNIKAIKILGKDNSGRITELEFISENNEVRIISHKFRNIIGPNIIRSTNFSVSIVNKDAVFEGFGWGHGVGLCQWGAYFMAKQGSGYEDILQHYYPQTKISFDQNP